MKMKNLTLITLLFLLLIGNAFSQSNLPQGMNYQAVARDFDGQIIADQDIHLRIRLLAGSKQERIVYTETHEVTTNKMGLFNLIIGEGQSGKEAFSAVPWSSEDIWLDIALDENGGSHFTPISTTRLPAPKLLASFWG